MPWSAPLSVKRVMAYDELVAMFDDFARAVGPATIADAYDPYWPAHLLTDAAVWRVDDGGTTIGWGALTPDPSEHAAWVSVGVWPDAQRHGARIAIRDWLVDHAERAMPNVDWLRIGVRFTNVAHLSRCFREAAAGGPWQPSGLMWMPKPGYAIFAHRVR